MGNKRVKLKKQQIFIQKKAVLLRQNKYALNKYELKQNVLLVENLRGQLYDMGIKEKICNKVIPLILRAQELLDKKKNLEYGIQVLPKDKLSRYDYIVQLNNINATLKKIRTQIVAFAPQLKEI